MDVYTYWCHNWITRPIYYRGSPARSRSSAAQRNVWLLNSNCIYNFVRNCHLKWIKCKPSARKIILRFIHTIKTERDFSYHNLEAMKYKITTRSIHVLLYFSVVQIKCTEVRYLQVWTASVKPLDTVLATDIEPCNSATELIHCNDVKSHPHHLLQSCRVCFQWRFQFKCWKQYKSRTKNFLVYGHGPSHRHSENPFCFNKDLPKISLKLMEPI